MKKRVCIIIVLAAILVTFLGINWMERRNRVPKNEPVNEADIGIQVDYMDDIVNDQMTIVTSQRIETRRLNKEGEDLKELLEDQAYQEIRLQEKERAEAERIAYEEWLAEQERIAYENWLAEQERIEEERQREAESAKQEEPEPADVAVEVEEPESDSSPEEPAEPVEEQSEEVEEPVEEVQEEPVSDGGCLTAWGGVYWYGDQKETYYNLDMSYVVYRAQQDGLEGDYWVRDDGCKMFGDYIILACNRDVHPYGSIVMTSLGAGISLDTGGFAYSNPYAVDIATTW